MTRAATRVVGVDVARALALLGMMSVHLLPEAHDDGTLTPAFLVSAGRASALFAVLAGVGLALATGGSRPRLHPRGRVTAATLTRAALVALTGLVLASLNPPVAVILVNYGLLFAVACPLLGARSRTLVAAAAGWAVAAPLLGHALRAHVSTGPGDQPSLATLGHPVEMLTHLVLTGYYPVLLWVPYVLLGLAVGRSRLDQPGTVARVAVAGLLLASVARVASDVLLRWRGWAALEAAGPLETLQPQLGLDQLQARGQYGVPPTTTWWWQAVASPHTGTPFDLAATTGTALVVIGACVLLTQAAARTSSTWLAVGRWLVAVLAAAGSMTLTLYSLHVVAAALAPAGSAGGEDHRGRLLAAHVAVALLLAVAWKASPTTGPRRGNALPALATGRRGPLEAAVARASSLAADAVPPPAATRPAPASEPTDGRPGQDGRSAADG